MVKTLRSLVSLICILSSTNVLATAYTVPPPDMSLIGKQIYRSTSWNETATSIALHYDIGFNALEDANPHGKLKNSLPNGLPLTIPTQHLLPDLPRKGIVINLPEMRMYYYLSDGLTVLTYPIGIGKIGKTIPITETYITEKKINPTWRPPDDIREFNLEQGIVLPKVMPPGADNPLGPYAIYMKLPTYLIHSTIFPESVGKRASFGCIRMYESDIQTFFPSIERGIAVAIINSPVKVGWQNDRLFMEAHPPLEEHSNLYEASMPGMIHQITSLTKQRPVLIDWQLVSFLNETRDGLPHEVGMQIFAHNKKS